MKEREFINENIAMRVCENLASRGMTGVYAATRKEACEEVAERIPAGSLVGLGGSVTLIESGMIERLRGMDIELLDRYREGATKEEIAEMRVRGMTSDVFIASTNAITVGGVLVNEDGLGNRVAGMIFGPKKVILIAGINKVVHSVEEGLARIKQVVAPMNSLRFGADTACAKTGFCDDDNCRPPNRICSQIAIIESNLIPDRVTVILVGESMGF